MSLFRKKEEPKVYIVREVPVEKKSSFFETILWVLGAIIVFGMLASCTKEETSFIDMDAYNTNASWVDGASCTLKVTEWNQWGTNVSTVTFEGTVDVICSVCESQKLRYAIGENILTFTPDINWRAWEKGTCCWIEDTMWIVLPDSEITKDGGHIKIRCSLPYSKETKDVLYEWERTSTKVADFQDGGMVELNF